MPEFLQKFLSELSTEDAKKVFNWFEEDDDTKPMPKILEDHRNSFSTEQEIEFESWAYSIDPAEGREAIMDVIAVTHIGFRVFNMEEQIKKDRVILDRIEKKLPFHYEYRPTIFKEEISFLIVRVHYYMKLLEMRSK